VRWLNITLPNPHDDPDAVRRWRHGVLEMQAGRLVRLRLHWLPKIISRAAIYTAGRWVHGRMGGDRLWLYYNQPLSAPQYLSLAYVVSTRETSYQSLWRAMATLDEIAQIKRSDGIVCELSNRRISHRLMQRLGYARHLEDSRGRHYIKRFYGDYSTRLYAQTLAPTHEPAVVTAG